MRLPKQQPRRRGRALFSKPAHRFRAGDAVRCVRGAMRGKRGIVVRGLGGRVRAGPDQIWVQFEGEEAPSRARRGALAPSAQPI